jgi:hypothetical protein
MANVLNGMTHLSMDIQLMAFRFLELLVLNFPSSFPRYAEQVSGIQSCIAVFKVTCFASVVSKFVCYKCTFMVLGVQMAIPFVLMNYAYIERPELALWSCFYSVMELWTNEYIVQTDFRSC